jgi:hypothetical protein
MEIIEQNDVVPHWDKEAAVKYITWNRDQWVSACLDALMRI